MVKETEVEINPFSDDIVFNPRQIKASVPALNDAVLQAVLAEFSPLDHFPKPRKQTSLDHALFIVSPHAGYGKTHLLGRIFKALRLRATCIYITGVEDSQTCWKAILERAVNELRVPESNALGWFNPYEASQLDEFAHQVIANLIADLVEQRVIRVRNINESLTKALRDGSLSTYEKAKQNKPWVALLEFLMTHPEYPERLAGYLDAQGLELVNDALIWLKILYAYSWSNNRKIRRAVVDWLKGEALPAEIADKVGIERGVVAYRDFTAGQHNDTCKNRLLDLCALAGFYKPFLFAFDQTERFGKDSGLARTFGSVIRELCKSPRSYNHMTVVTANRETWNKFIQPYWEQAYTHVLNKSEALTLVGLNRQQAHDLVVSRLQRRETYAQHAEQFLADEKFIDKFFGPFATMSVRSFLQMCSVRWRKTKPMPVEEQPVLSDIYAEIAKGLLGDALKFDREILHWFVHQVMKTSDGIEVTDFELESGKRLISLRKGRAEAYIDFEESAHYRRWEQIIEQAQVCYQENQCLRWICLRTPELEGIPGLWPKLTPIIEDAKRTFLRIITLTQEQLRKIYAGYQLYLNTLNGKTIFSLEQVASLLRNEFVLMERQFANLLNMPNPDLLALPKSNYKLIQEIKVVLQKERFISMDDLCKRLTGKHTREAIIDACESLLEIKIHYGESVIMVHWQEDLRMVS